MELAAEMHVPTRAAALSPASFRRSADDVGQEPIDATGPGQPVESIVVEDGLAADAASHVVALEQDTAVESARPTPIM